jgi:hypothetical protein
VGIDHAAAAVLIHAMSEETLSAVKVPDSAALST